jgi:NAD(P)H-nitrite reductase large subunit
MKKFILLASILVTGCSTVDRMVCYGNGTCDLNPKYADQPNQPLVNTASQTIITNNGTYLITRDTQGSVNAVIQTSKGK